jgi:hypothetical protein
MRLLYGHPSQPKPAASDDELWPNANQFDVMTNPARLGHDTPFQLWLAMLS